MPKRHLAATLALVVMASGGFAAPAAANSRHGDDHHDKHHHGHHDDGEPGEVTVVADNLNSPRQIIEHEGALYVAEAGTGGDLCIPEAEVCIGLTGSVTRVKHHHVSRVQTGLLSVGSPEGGEFVGVDALAFKGGKLYGIAAGTCDDLTGLPEEITDQLGKVLRLHGGDEVSAVGDPAAFECENDPDGQGRDTDPYGLAARGKSFYVADAAGNDIVKVRKGETTLAAVLSTTGQPVPTSLAWGPHGDLYIGTLNFEGGPGGASVYRLDVDTGDLSVYATGFTAITGIAFGRHGRLYVAEWTTGFGPMGPSPDGDIVSVPYGGGLEGRKIIGAGAVHFPGGVAVNNGDVYVSNWSIASGEDGPFGPGNHGQLIKISQ